MEERSRNAGPIGWMVLGLACASPVVEGSGTGPPVGSGADSQVETEQPDTPAETDPGETPAETDPAETSPEPQQPPSTLGAGFVEVAGATWALGAELPIPGGGAGTDEWPENHWVAAGDIGDDGVLDLVVGFARRPSTDGGGPLGQVYTWDGASGQLRWSASRTATLHQSFSQVQAVVDLDGDGRTDLLRSNPDGLFQLSDGGDSWTTVDLITPAERPSFGGMRATALVDFDLDGWLDVVIGPDECSRVPRYPVLPILRTGLRRWEARVDLAQQSPPGDSYAVLSAPLGGEGPYLLQIGQECDPSAIPTGFQQVTRRDGGGWPVYESLDPIPSDALFRLDPGAAGRPISVISPMGAAAVDLDADGLLEVAITPSESWVVVLEAGWPLMTDRTVEAGVDVRSGADGTPQLPWGIAPVDVDADGAPDLVVAHGDDGSSTYRLPANGPYQPSVHWNDGQGRFTEITSVAGMFVDGNWHAVTVLDLDQDADPDVAIGGYGVLPLIFRNQVNIGNHQLAIRLAGTTSNHLGMGAVLKIEVPGLPPQLRLMGEIASVDVVSEPVIFVGIGAAVEAERVTITWPSGLVQEVLGLAAGQTHTVREPELIVLSEADRHLPADGVSQLVVTVAPRAADGSPRAAVVDIAAPWGAAAFSGPIVQDGLSWSRTLVAPTTPGSGVIEVSVDGVVVPVRPRIWWD